MSETEKERIEREPIILALDTSSKATSVAIARGKELVLNFGAQLDENRSARLWSLIDFLLTETGFMIADIDLFAVCIGPGGFTGLRVGMTAAKGFAIAMKKPIVGVTSLEAVAGTHILTAQATTKVCVLNNAYKGEVYAQRFSSDTAGTPVAENEPMVGRLEEALDHIASERRIVITGDAAVSNREAIRNYARDHLPSDITTDDGWQVRDGEQFLAANVARIAYFRYKAGRAILPEALQACYVRGADIKVKPQA